jgi:dihydroorotate dehydrogenase electron transfer subunit
MESLAARITRREEVAPHHIALELDCPALAHEATPGQFVHVRVSGTDDPLLRRPISIMLRDNYRGRIEILVRAVGRGTAILSNLAPGSALDIIGPLGHGFPVPEEGSTVLLVAGGVGVAPLIFLADTLQLAEQQHYVRGLLGAATEDMLVCWQDFAGRCEAFQAATEDGTAGTRGLVTELVPEQLRRGVDIVYTCGPRPMMARVSELCAEQGVPCWASLEQFMGCGVGACLGCVIPTRLQPRHRRVCKDGPVFSASQVAWEELSE